MEAYRSGHNEAVLKGTLFEVVKTILKFLQSFSEIEFAFVKSLDFTVFM